MAEKDNASTPEPKGLMEIFVSYGRDVDGFREADLDKLAEPFIAKIKAWAKRCKPKKWSSPRGIQAGLQQIGFNDCRAEFLANIDKAE